MRSSIARVAIGSRAAHGSSMSRISGLSAIARAMHSRCCWPPESAKPDSSSWCLTSPQRPARVRASSTRSFCLGLLQLPAVDPRPVGDVVVDRLGERVGLLEHHADPAPDLDRVDVGAVEVLPVVEDPALDPGLGTRSLVRLKQRRTVDLPQPEGPMNAVISLRPDLQVDSADGPEVAVEDVQALHVEDRRGAPRPCTAVMARSWDCSFMVVLTSASRTCCGCRWRCRSWPAGSSAGGC